MAWRAEWEVRAAHTKYKNDLNVIENANENVIPSIISCHHATIHPAQKTQLYAMTSMSSIDTCQNTHTAHRPIDSQNSAKKKKKNVTTILLKRMGKVALQRTWLGLTTQKVEAMNHAFSTMYPKHSMTCYCNGVNRDHSAIHMVNNWVEDSILVRTRAYGVPISPNAPV